jgi:hypothetical protein
MRKHVVRNELQCPAKELSVSRRAIFVAISLAGLTLVGTAVNEVAAPIVVEGATPDMRLVPSTLPPTRSLATLPTFTPRRGTRAGSQDAPRAGYAAAALPALTPQRSLSSLPAVTSPREPQATRAGCDPAYPDERTCIPPGPPFDQGCAITDDRRFTVMAPDPQRLDHDGDGIGCEPIRSSRAGG